MTKIIDFFIIFMNFFVCINVICVCGCVRASVYGVYVYVCILFSNVNKCLKCKFNSFYI